MSVSAERCVGKMKVFTYNIIMYGCVHLYNQEFVSPPVNVGDSMLVTKKTMDTMMTKTGANFLKRTTK